MRGDTHGTFSSEHFQIVGGTMAALLEGGGGLICNFRCMIIFCLWALNESGWWAGGLVGGAAYKYKSNRDVQEKR